MKVRGFEKVSFNQYQKEVDNKEIYDDIKLPARGTSHSAGYDFFSPFDFALKPTEIIKIPTGIKAYMLHDEWLALIIRSGLGFKYNIRTCNQVGVIDSDYYNNEKNEGHIFLALQNEGKVDWVVKKGEAIIQGIFMKYLVIDNDAASNKIRKGGLGSTDK